MALFSRKTEIEKNSLVVAFCDLLQNFGISAEPEKLSKILTDQGVEFDGSTPDDLLWNSITDFNHRVVVKEVGFYGTWPNSLNSIVKFQYQPQDEPYIEAANGERIANILDHYCLLADLTDHNVVDSADGTIKNPAIFGQPVAWAVYELTDEPEKPAAKSGHLYRLLKGENIWSVARKFRTSAQDLIEHNDLSDPYALGQGDQIHLPVAQQSAPEPLIHYEILDGPRKMHVSKSHGATKWSFGNVRQWKDLKSTGPTFPLDSNVDIVAIAHVPISDEVAAYYMDPLALGNYAETGRPSFTIGFNHSHLGEGYVEKPSRTLSVAGHIPGTTLSEEKLERLKVVIKNSQDKPQPGLAELPVTVLDYREPDLTKPPFTSSYVAFDNPTAYTAHETIWVHDHAGKRPDRQLLANQEVIVSGTFIKEDVLYGRPLGAAKNFLWFGVPMDNLISNAELYNGDIALAEKVALRNGVLSPSERGVVALSKILAQGTRLKTYIGKIKTKI